VFVCRVLALLLPLPVSLVALPTLRSMAQQAESLAGQAGEMEEPALRPGSV
jgi:hypothetical protein